jgi:hypothetical protein
MKKNDERILKYLSDLMDEGERLDFEKELASSDELKSGLDSVSNQLDEVSYPKAIEADERYFANLLPRVRERLDKKKKLISWKSVYYLTSTAAAVVILSIFLFSSKTEFKTQYKDLANEVVNNFSDQEVSEKYFAELESNLADIIMTTSSERLNLKIPSEVEINGESYTRLIGSTVSEDYRTLSDLSDRELEIVYEKLNSATSQKVTK